MISYIPILLMFVIAVGFAVTMIIVSRIFGKNRPTATKLMPYECGMNPIGNARERFSVKFYLVAMVFLLFDTAYFFPDFCSFFLQFTMDGNFHLLFFIFKCLFFL